MDGHWAAGPPNHQSTEPSDHRTTEPASRPDQRIFAPPRANTYFSPPEPNKWVYVERLATPPLRHPRGSCHPWRFHARPRVEPRMPRVCPRMPPVRARMLRMHPRTLPMRSRTPRMRLRTARMHPPRMRPRVRAQMRRMRPRSSRTRPRTPGSLQATRKQRFTTLPATRRPSREPRVKHC